MVEREDLIIPVYLNQRVVFDLVAMLQGGIASVTQVTQTQTDSRNVSGEVSSTFGLSQALSSLLRVDFSGKAGGTAAAETGETRNEQRIHTPASLFIALRALLREKSYIVNDDEGVEFRPGDIVEFSAVLQRNPLLETIGSFIELVDMMQTLTQGDPKKKSGQSSDMNRIKRQMESFVKALQGSDTLDLTTEPLSSAHRAVITLEQQYLNDPSMSDLVDGTFRVVGKVTRVVGDADEPISLNRKSAMGKLPPSVLGEMKQAFDSPDLGGFAFRPLEWEIEAPAIQVIPIAIFA
ncbi:MAG: hypothetical protein Q7J82_00265 [Coriobacteriia bacterium]|nr:hypothetical protein [Coriobacteriia bacterium]